MRTEEMIMDKPYRATWQTSDRTQGRQENWPNLDEAAHWLADEIAANADTWSPTSPPWGSGFRRAEGRVRHWAHLGNIDLPLPLRTNAYTGGAHYEFSIAKERQ